MHRARPDFDPSRPLHVVLRAHPAVGRLRRRKGYHALRLALARTLARPDFRVVHASIQHNHIHLLVEADDRDALARGMQALCISLSRRLNQALDRKGPAILHRYEVRAIVALKHARHAISYVLNNWRRHREDFRSAEARRAAIDPYSSGPRFDGWRDVIPAQALAALPRDYEPLPTASATTWALTVGWKRYGRIGTEERPGPWPD